MKRVGVKCCVRCEQSVVNWSLCCLYKQSVEVLFVVVLASEVQLDQVNCLACEAQYWELSAINLSISTSIQAWFITQ